MRNHRNNHRSGEDLRPGDLVYDRYHKRNALVVSKWGSALTGYFVELNQGVKIAAEYAEKLN
ncbi:MAG: hypothetical protein CMQ51_06920 [Gammaproteobacteria bacterium]|nr:hypothetical protein [Gammaproteobacteria bacterium]